jgi:hypothetical protein
MLARAKSASLIYRGLGYARDVTDQQREVELLQDISRVQVLALFAPRDYLSPALRGALTTPAPIMEALELDLSVDDVYPASSLLFDGKLLMLWFLRIEAGAVPLSTALADRGSCPQQDLRACDATHSPGNGTPMRPSSFKQNITGRTSVFEELYFLASHSFPWRTTSAACFRCSTPWRRRP